MWAMPRALSAGGLLASWVQPPVETVRLTSRSLVFTVHPIDARPAARDAVRAFAYRYGAGWQVLYVGRRVEHKIGTAIGYGATHLLVLEDGTADEAWLIDELRPPLNGC
jgi:hypothetical protein